MRGLRLCCLALALSPARALAYRPFGQTDAGVAEPGELELELGPAGFLRQGALSSLQPGVVLNLGLPGRLEVVAEGHAGIALGALAPGEGRWTLEPALLLKGVLREGSLQEGTGPSVALEAGVLLPDVPALAGMGGSLALIASQRWTAAAVHVNVLAERSRDGTFAFTGGAIVEGPRDWLVCPVAEAFAEYALDGGMAASLLAGAIWRVRDAISVDGAIRVGSASGLPELEVRAGVTWAVSLGGR